ncbi:DUF6531 domain-containing protein [Kitasatospora cineracea]|uniref:DUF6531 domain-containing protein n=1 Tax=Kitasatospora cineracea TaxID=88074 RepID=UPI00381BBB1E
MSNQIVKALEHGAQKLGKTLAEDAGKALKGFYRKAGDNLKTVAKNTREIEEKHAKDLARILKGEGKDGVPHPRSHPGDGRGSGPGGQRLRDGATRPRETAVPPKRRRCRSDPIDIASGEMLLQHEDVRLPGLLPLLLTRTHVSSYRCGGWFGPSWASTLDQRLELDPDGVVFAAEDGTLLVYPPPTAGTPVLPVEGPRLPLAWDPESGSEILIGDPFRGVTWHFDSADEAVDRPGSHGAAQLPLRAMTDRNGNRIDVVYSATGTPVEVRHSGGYRVAVDTAGPRITGFRLLGPVGEGPEAAAADGEPVGAALAGFRYDGNGNLADVLDASGRPLRLTYDEAGRITSWTGRNQFRYRYVYDRSGRCVQTRGDGGFLDAVFAYDTERRITTVRDSLGHLTAYQLNEAGQTTAETDAAGGVALFAWDPYDRLLSHTDQLGRTTSYDYDADGNVSRVSLPDGTVASAAYNEAHQPLEAVQPDGTRWQFEYDERGNLLLTTAPDGAQTRCTYGEFGHLRSVTDPLGNRKTFTTDAAGLVLGVTDPLGGTSRCVRDASGNPTAVTDALGGVTTFGWDAEGMLAWRTDPEGRTSHWSYDARGDLTEHRNANGGTTVFEYGPFGVPTSRVDPDGTRYAFTHDTELRLTGVTNAQGLAWRYELDALDGLVAETDFNGRTVRYASDAAGQLVERTNGAGQTVTLHRDAIGRVVESRTGAGAVTAFRYDAAGRMVRAETPDCVLEHTHDAVGRLVAERTDGRLLTRAYDLAGRLVRRTTPSGAVSQWTYDANGRPERLVTQEGELSFQHDAAGRETARHFGAGGALTQGWNAAGQLVGQALWTQDTAEGHPESTGYRQLQGRNYAYRADGHPTRITDRLGGNRQFELDQVGRVTAVRAETWSETYAYDSLGNLKHAVFPAGDDSAQGEREHSGTLVRRAGRTVYRHDEQGRVVRAVRNTSAGRAHEWQYHWDAEDRLTEVVTPDDSVWRYRYDALGRRVSKERLAANGGIAEQTLFSWDGTTLAEQHAVRPDTESTTTWEWEPGTYHAAAQLDRTWRTRGGDRTEVDRRFHAIVTDLVGSPAELVAPDGTIVWRSSTTLWGRPSTPSDSTVHCPLRFPGQYHDAETGLDYNLARYYDADTASYLSPDPLGLSAAPNHHAYVGNPLWWMDPLGLKGKITRIYDDSDYAKHVEGKAGSSSKGEIGRAPSNGQGALDRSISRTDNNPNAPRRLGVDHENNEIVVLDRHLEFSDKNGDITEYYQGHVQSKYPSDTVTESHLTKLVRLKMIDSKKKQRVLPPPEPCED